MTRKKQSTIKHILPHGIPEIKRQRLTNDSDGEETGKGEDISDTPACIQTGPTVDGDLNISKPDSSEGATYSEICILETFPSSGIPNVPPKRQEFFVYESNCRPISLLLNNCDFHITVCTSLNFPRSDPWSCEFGTFKVCLKETGLNNVALGLPKVYKFWIYVSNAGEHLVYFEVAGKGNSMCIVYPACMEYDIEHLKVLKSRKDAMCEAVYDDYDPSCRVISIKVYLLSTGLRQLAFPSESQVPRQLTVTGKQLLMWFHGITFQVFYKSSNKNECDVKAFFAAMKGKKLSRSKSVLDVRHRGLKPTLRPYQVDAVQWMLEKEQMQPNSDCLHRLYKGLEMIDGQILYYNIITGCIVRDKPVSLPLPRGGILADEMGLGKTVEVLACMLCHPRDVWPDRDSQIQNRKLETVYEVDPENGRENSMGKENQATCGPINRPCLKSESCIPSVDMDENIVNGFDHKHEIESCTGPEDKLDKTYFGCICGASSPEGNEQVVQCTRCGIQQHVECLGWDVASQLPYECPYCLVKQAPRPIKATLVVVPKSICHQWTEEVEKHIGLETFNVMVYTGRKKMDRYIQPATLARQDLVLVTYEAFKTEVDLPNAQSDNDRNFRNPRRWMPLPSPLITVQWWRVCLDEAQMIENVTAKSAEMALRLPAVNRWCVTGTPIHKSFKDLYGLAVFLGYDPYWIEQWWQQCLYGPYTRGSRGPLHEAMSEVFWRNSKQDVLDQIKLPPQTERIHWLRFNPVEEHFYRCQRRMSSWMADLTQFPWNTSDATLGSLNQSSMSKVFNAVSNLRRACVHPLAVGRQCATLRGSVYNMGVLLESMIDKTRTEVEESNRQIVAARNGIAAIQIIKGEFAEAVSTYRGILRSINRDKHIFKTDDLQVLHTVHNLSEVLLGRSEEQGEQGEHGVSQMPGDEELTQQAETIRSKYLSRYSFKVSLVIEDLDECQERLKQLETQFVGARGWWCHILKCIKSAGSDEDMISKIKDELRGLVANTSHKSLAGRFRDVNGLKFVLGTHLNDLANTHQCLVERMTKLSRGPPDDTLIRDTVACCLRPTKRKPRKCEFCQIHLCFDAYESNLFLFSDREEITEVPDEGNTTAQHRGTWADSDAERILKIILSFTKKNPEWREFVEDGEMHIKLFSTMKKEFKLLRELWMASRERACAYDELSMAMTRLQVNSTGEVTTDCPHIIDKLQIEPTYIRLIADESTAQRELVRKKAHLSYLNTLSKAQTSIQDGYNTEPCPVCRQELGIQWAVLPCFHFLCMECLTFVSRGKNNFNCPLCRQTTALTDINYVYASQQCIDPISEISVKGNHSAKIQAIVQCLKSILKRDCKAKSLVFTTWVDVLLLIGSALEMNKIGYTILNASHKAEENLQRFRNDENVSVLLLPVRCGSKGLNLTEASHVLFVEPLLNLAEEMQAIGRIHRIGQKRATVIHRFLVHNTVEDKIYNILASLKTKQADTVLIPDDNPITIGEICSLFSD